MMKNTKYKITKGAYKHILMEAELNAKKNRLVAAQRGMSNNEIAAMMPQKKSTFHASVEWKALRKKVIGTYGAKCMKCGYAPKNLSRINIDHIKPRKYYPELALEFDNLQVLCCACNKEKGNSNTKDWRPVSHN